MVFTPKNHRRDRYDLNRVRPLVCQRRFVIDPILNLSAVEILWDLLRLVGGGDVLCKLSICGLPSVFSYLSSDLVVCLETPIKTQGGTSLRVTGSQNGALIALSVSTSDAVCARGRACAHL